MQENELIVNCNLKILISSTGIHETTTIFAAANDAPATILP